MSNHVSALAFNIYIQFLAPTTHLYIIECLKFFIKRGIYAQINGTLFYRGQ